MKAAESKPPSDTTVTDQPTDSSSLPLPRPFHPTNIPPDFSLATLHAVLLRQKARRVLRLKDKFQEDGETLADFCPCCHYPHEGQQFPLLCEPKDLAELGEGFPLYFDLAKWLHVLLLATLAIAGAYSLYCNYTENNLSDSSLSSNWIMRSSLGTVYAASFGDSSSPSILEPSLHIAAMILLLALHSYLVVRHENMEDELDQNTITPSDYTILVANLPRTDLHVQDLVDFLSERSRPVYLCRIGNLVGLSKSTWLIISLPFLMLADVSRC